MKSSTFDLGLISRFMGDTWTQVNQLPRLSGRWDTQIEYCPHGWQIPETQPRAPIPGTRHTDETVEGRKIGMGGGEDAKWTAPQTTAQTLDEQLADPSRVQSYHKPCEPALMGLTAGCPLSSWTAWPLSLVHCLTAKLVNRLTAKLVDHLTTKLVVVNLVKLHFLFLFLNIADVDLKVQLQIHQHLSNWTRWNENGEI